MVPEESQAKAQYIGIEEKKRDISKEQTSKEINYSKRLVHKPKKHKSQTLDARRKILVTMSKAIISPSVLAVSTQKQEREGLVCSDRVEAQRVACGPWWCYETDMFALLSFRCLGSFVSFASVSNPFGIFPLALPVRLSGTCSGFCSCSCSLFSFTTLFAPLHRTAPAMLAPSPTSPTCPPNASA